jgi:DUF4097 and DUF4098 domain-containing protein YvlB
MNTGRWIDRAAALAVLTVLSAGLASAQRAERWELDCDRDADDDWGARFCVIEERTLPVGRGPIRVDADPNGGVTVVGWDRNEIALRVKIQAHARTEERASDLGKAVRLVTNEGEIRAEGPETGRREWWSASFELRVPKSSDLRLRAKNGGIRVASVSGEMDLSTLNGGLTLDAVGGNVRAETTNGGVEIELTGRRWDGAGLDVRTTNGGIELLVPADYSADLETGTVNGGLDIDFPVQVQGRISRRITTRLGDGGAPIRAVTTNGGVSVRRA